ncbi:MAG TPA: polysaccharide deacetylase family protein [Firmicutes bacterium]|nr:polysaccharide deacetylase family protein [Bacillota bacterium]
MVFVVRSLPRESVPGAGQKLTEAIPEPARTEPNPEPKLVEYDGSVEHIFFHPLIAYPELAFDGDGMSRGYDDWFVTVSEFKKIIQMLYENGYMLVGIDDVLGPGTVDGKPGFVPKKLFLPEGKKPLIISVDDLCYYDYMRKNGNVYKLVLDEEGQVATYSVSPEGKEVISRDNEIIPILDSFVRHHPDFSLRGAKGIIALTGYEGILGYRTNDPESPEYEKEKEQALAVIEQLKRTGWSFACHGWGHLDMEKVSYKRFVQDTERWKREVEPLIGQTKIYVYPFGSQVKPGTPKFEYLLQTGFTIFCGIGIRPFLPKPALYVLMDRRHVDGIALKTQRELLIHLFDASQALDR